MPSLDYTFMVPTNCLAVIFESETLTQVFIISTKSVVPTICIFSYQLESSLASSPYPYGWMWFLNWFWTALSISYGIISALK
jgi:hypothetical protein